MWAYRLAAGAVFAFAALAGDRLLLKTRVIDTAALEGLTDAPPARRVDPSRRRIIVQFERPVERWRVDELQRRGGRGAQLLPVDALVISLPEAAELDGLGVTWTGELLASDKLSPLLDAEERGFVLETFPDVRPDVAASITAAAGGRVRARVGPRQYLIAGGSTVRARLAEWDAAAYLFPEPVPLDARLCAMPPSTPAQPGQYAADSGAMWAADGADAIGVHLGTMEAEHAGAKESIERALAEWARYAEIHFTSARSAAEPRSIDFRFGAREHGDAWAFDGAGGVVAHAFYPEPRFEEPLAGDVHFDSAESWGSVDLYSFALHETGHALGLGHSDDRASVMYPFVLRAAGLGASDIAELRRAYPPRVDPVEEDAPPRFDLRAVSPDPRGWLIVAGRATGAGPPRLRWRIGDGPWTHAVGAYDWVVPALPLLADSMLVTLEVRAARGEASEVYRVARDGSFALETPPAQDPPAVTTPQ